MENNIGWRTILNDKRYIELVLNNRQINK